METIVELIRLLPPEVLSVIPAVVALVSSLGAKLAPLLWTAGILWALWVFYLAVMCLKSARDGGRLGPVAYAFGVPTLALGYLLDVAVNIVIFTVMFLEFPTQATVTARLKKHAPLDSWRGRMARWIALHLLDPFDPDGKHV